jgi:hypothetical protein
VNRYEIKQLDYILKGDFSPFTYYRSAFGPENTEYKERPNREVVIINDCPVFFFDTQIVIKADTYEDCRLVRDTIVNTLLSESILSVNITSEGILKQKFVLNEDFTDTLINSTRFNWKQVTENVYRTQVTDSLSLTIDATANKLAMYTDLVSLPDAEGLKLQVFSLPKNSELNNV